LTINQFKQLASIPLRMNMHGKPKFQTDMRLEMVMAVHNIVCLKVLRLIIHIYTSISF